MVKLLRINEKIPNFITNTSKAEFLCTISLCEKPNPYTEKHTRTSYSIADSVILIVDEQYI